MSRSPVLGMVALLIAGCAHGAALEAPAPHRNLWSLSAFTARPRAGGTNEGPMGRKAAVTYSELVEDLRTQDILVDRLGPLNTISDPRTLLAVMNTFTRSLGVQCEWCHRADDYAAPTPRKAVAAFMWDQFVQRLAFHDGHALYCDSCHHETTVFLGRRTTDSLSVMQYMQSEYVDQLARRDGRAHGCTTCHGEPVNLRFLPRLHEPAGYAAPPAQPGPQAS